MLVRNSGQRNSRSWTSNILKLFTHASFPCVDTGRSLTLQTGTDRERAQVEETYNVQRLLFMFFISLIG
jgi:hypothetical protein